MNDSSKKKRKPVRGLAQQIEKIVVPDEGEYDAVEEFVPPFIEEMAKHMALPDFDLTNPTSASEATQMLEEKLQQLRGYRNRSQQLKQALLNRKFELETDDEGSH